MAEAVAEYLRQHKSIGNSRSNTIGLIIVVLVACGLTVLYVEGVRQSVSEATGNAAGGLLHSKSFRDQSLRFLNRLSEDYLSSSETEQLLQRKFEELLLKSEDSINEAVKRVLQDEAVVDVAFNLSRDIAGRLCNDPEVIEQVGQLLLDAIYTDVAVNGAANWFVDLTKRDDVRESLERLLCDQVFYNARIQLEALNFCKDVSSRFLRDAETRRESLSFIKALLERPSFQAQLSQALLGVVKHSVYPRWLTTQDAQTLTALPKQLDKQSEHGKGLARMTKGAYHSSQLLTYGPLAKVLYHIVAFMDGYDLQTLSVCMRAFEITLNLSPSSLSVMATAETVALVACCPIWGYLVDLYKCRYVLACAMTIAGVASILLGCASDFTLLILLRILHGCALGCTPPAMQQLITASTSEGSHGTAFGILYAVSCFGRLIAAIVTTTVAGLQFLGYPGWRTCYIVFGILWIAMAFVVMFVMKSSDEDDEHVPEKKEHGNILETMRAIFKTWTSRLLLFGIFISDAPFCAFTYMILYLQYLGISDFSAGVACALTLLGGLIGGGFGGYLVDRCHQVSAKYGRLIAGNVLMVIRLVAALALFLGPAPDGSLQWYQIVELMTIGASLMTVSSIDRPIMAAVVEKKYQASATGINRCIAGVVSSTLFLSLAGYLTEAVFGYVPSSDPIEKMEKAKRLANSDALGKSMMYIICIGTLLNLICYIAFFFTYPKDCMVNAEVEDLKTASTEC
ncbi:putative sulfoacetate transporter SauU [Babesia sp. Xinjiang]|uniref:putative sulfoacetate transporter SauU n=1 Tax=Babesia sp. Xinjiang TaxID=462227 RepID=UPI000A248B70|nr:putative sulfoacetate transporter SauU [Babesia sp. Xinjiang]ORM39493.1 putative sulfoacetate transporter SauU [Babesia sp. Xinjiang]